MVKTRTLAAILCLATVGMGSVALAESPVLDGTPPVKNRVKLLDGRHVVTPQFGITLRDPYVRNLMFGVGYRYYFNAWLGMGVDVLAGTGIDTALTSDINKLLSEGAPTPFQISTTSLQMLAHVNVELVPFVGKLMAFGDTMLRMDVHVNLGVGVAMVKGVGRIDDSTGVSPWWGVGVRFYPGDWISVGIDIKDFIVERALSSRSDGSVPGATFGHNWFLGLSVGFSFPMTPEIEE